MPYIQPGPGDVHVNRPLTNLSIAYPNDGFVADRVFPNIPVNSRSDVFFTYDRGFWNRASMQPRAPSTESSGATYGLSTDSYIAKRWALHRDIDDEVAANADSPINLDREAMEFLTRQALLNREVNWAAAFFTTGIWTTDTTGVAAAPGANQVLQWSDPSSTPIEDVRARKRAIRERTGAEANKFVMGRKVFDDLMDHPDVVARLDRGQTPNGPALANADSLAAIFGVDEILVMEAIQNTANEGAANVHAFIGGRSALLVNAPPRAGVMTLSGGYTFSWTGFLGATPSGWRIKRWRMEEITSFRVELEQYYVQKKISADVGSFFATIVAA